MESETTAYEQATASEDPEKQERNWLSLPEGERTAYRTKALAHMAEAMRATIDKSEGEPAARAAAWNRRNQLLFKGEGGGTPSREDYAVAAETLEGIETSTGDMMERIAGFLASAQLDLMAMRMMRRDRQAAAS